METDKKYGFGIIGIGNIGKFHAKAIASLEDAELIGVYSRSEDKRNAFASAHNCKSYGSLSEMLEDERIQVVNICTPSGAHLDPALEAIKAGKHCLIEKPMEITVARCDQMIKAAKERGVKIGVIFQSRFNEAARRIKAAIDEKRFGDPVLGDAYVKWHRSAEYYESGAWRGTWKLDGGGALMNQGIHSVDLLQWYMGDVESVQAYAANRRHKKIEVEDTVVAAVKFKSGALGTIECSTAIFPGALKKIEVKGTKGSAVLEEDRLIEWKFEKEEKTDEDIRGGKNAAGSSGGGAADPMVIDFSGHQRQIADFIEAIQKDGKPFIDGAEGKKSVAIVEAVYESAKTGKEVLIKN